MIKRFIRVNYEDGTFKDLEIIKSTAIKADVGMMHLDKLNNDKWRLTFTNEIGEEFSKIKNFEMIREDW